MNFFKWIASLVLAKEIEAYKADIVSLWEDIAQNHATIEHYEEKVSEQEQTIKAFRSDLNECEETDTVAVVKELYSEEDITPTQGDKPSAHSSLNKTQALSIKSFFPEPQYKLYTVANTNSMEPFIDANTIVICEKLTSRVIGIQPIVKGDICIYNHDNLNIIHRVKQVKDNLYYFRGDNNFFSDGWVARTAIKYRYVGQIQTKQILEGD